MKFTKSGETGVAWWYQIAILFFTFPHQQNIFNVTEKLRMNVKMVAVRIALDIIKAISQHTCQENKANVNDHKIFCPLHIPDIFNKTSVNGINILHLMWREK